MPTKQQREFLRLVRLHGFWDQVRERYTVDISYETGSAVTPRTVEVAEAFGLGVDTKQKFTLYDRVTLDINADDVVYITGDSGSGKSVLLKWLVAVLGDRALNIDDVSVDPDKPLIDTLGATTGEAIELLSRVGLNDAFLFLRPYGQLSDGQRYRYRLAKLLESQRPYWVMDEFCATLDRDTAKIVAFNVQRLARQRGVCVLACTTHRDLAEDLKPTVLVHKRFGRDVHVAYQTPTDAGCSVLADMHVEPGSYADWKQLSPFHYRDHTVSFLQKIFVLRRGDGELCGAIVYATPTASCFGRARVFRPRSMQDLNAQLTRISRVVVHPKYRTIGAGVKLVRESLPRCGKPMVETLAVMARYNPFFEHAGMTRVAETEVHPNALEAVEGLEQLGFQRSFLSVSSHNLQLLRRPGTVRAVKAVLRRVRYPYNRRLAGDAGHYTMTDWQTFLRKASAEDLGAALKRLAQVAQTKVYLFWQD